MKTEAFGCLCFTEIERYFDVDRLRDVLRVPKDDDRIQCIDLVFADQFRFKSREFKSILKACGAKLGETVGLENCLIRDVIVYGARAVGGGSDVMISDPQALVDAYKRRLRQPKRKRKHPNIQRCGGGGF